MKILKITMALTTTLCALTSCSTQATTTVDTTPVVTTTTTSNTEYTLDNIYIISECRYYTDGTVIDTDGNVWLYYTNSLYNDVNTYDNMPVYMVMDNNDTESDITLETNFNEADFEMYRDCNNITLTGGYKK